MLIYVPGTPNSHHDIRAIQTAGRGIYTFTIVPNRLSGKFRRKAISITCDTYEQALNYVHRFTTMYNGKPKKLVRFTNATIVEIAWQSEDENNESGTAVVVVPGTEIKYSDMADTLVEFVKSNAKQVVISRPNFTAIELL